MSLMTMLQSAQGGQAFAQIAQSLDLDVKATEAAMEKLCPAVALKLKARAEEDEDLFQTLLDVIEDGEDASPLDETEGLTGSEAISDGNAILEDIYGSRNKAMVALRAIASDVGERELAKLAPISATAVVAALAKSNRPMAAADMPQTAMGDAKTGIIGTIVGALVTSAVSAAMRELNSAVRRSTTSYTKSRSRRRTSPSSKKKKKTSTKKSTARKSSSSRRTTTSASIEDIFRDILANVGK
jgi:hypothetical protein